MNDIPPNIRAAIDEIMAPVGAQGKAREIDIRMWWQLPIPALGKSAEQAVADGQEKMVLEWLDAIKHGTYT